MNMDRRTFIKGMNRALAGVIAMLGFVGCEKFGVDEYGTPHADYTVKGAVVSKATGKPIQGIQVGYVDNRVYPAYGPPPAYYGPKASVLTNARGEFLLTDRYYYFDDKKPTFPVSITDSNGLFQPEYFEVDFNNAKHSGKSKSWYEGEYTVNLNVELTEVEDQ